VLADGVDFAYLRSAAQEGPVELFKVLEGNAGCRVCQERRRSAGDEDKQEIPLLKLLQKLLYFFGRLGASLIGLRMGGDEGLESGWRLLVASFDHAQATV
jgi:hypothetical protein